MLLAASCIFYMYFIPVYILILFVTIGIDYVMGILIEKAPQEKKKSYLIVSLVANIGFLAFFKYCNFFIDNVNQIATFLHWNYSISALNIILPIGLSFHTFQAMSYTIEVYRGNQKAERHLGIFALYVMYYPQLVAGPIERPQNILPQLHVKHNFDYDRFVSGLKKMLWGFFKKVVVADRLAYFVNLAYDNPENYPGISLFVAAVFFSFQIFCDFSGYSDIAIGASRIMGIELMDNFKHPYFSKSISEFWSRWHISLSTWFRDYLYIPLGGNRKGNLRWHFNIFIVFLLSGFWHGANWTFIVWGGLHGAYLVFANSTIKLREKINKTIGLFRFPKLYNILQVILVFILVTIAWVFFRAEDVGTAVKIIGKIVSGVPEYFMNALTDPHFLWLEPLFFNMYMKEILFDILIITSGLLFMELVHYAEGSSKIDEVLSKKATGLQWSFYLFLIFFVLIGGSFHSSAEFIYFQF
jgi:alginate O-acetyltransferase complex protein AlgI